MVINIQAITAQGSKNRRLQRMLSLNGDIYTIYICPSEAQRPLQKAGWWMTTRRLFSGHSRAVACMNSQKVIQHAKNLELLIFPPHFCECIDACM